MHILASQRWYSWNARFVFFGRPMSPSRYAFPTCSCASAFPSSTCFCSRRTHSASDFGAGARQSRQRASCCRHLSWHAVQIDLQQQE